MLDMLHPRNDLKLITMENVAREDVVLAGASDTFLGVDLTEYYGGCNSSNARRIVIVQVKYSPTNPDRTWTLNRLCANKASTGGKTKLGTSVLRKLANAFNAFYRKLGDKTSDKLQIKLHTNQSLDDHFRAQISQARSLVEGHDDRTGSKLLRCSEGQLLGVLDKMQEVTRLSWKRLAAFIRCWDLSGLGQAMLSTAEGQLYQLMRQYTSQGGVHIGGLIAFVQDHATSNRPTDITREDIYRQLRLREVDFFPAPTRFPPVDGLLFSQDAQRLIKLVDTQQKRKLLAHGVAGTGKTSALRLLAKHYGDGKATVIYDCFGGGTGLQAGAERFPYKKCFVQIINELDSLFHTNVLATTGLSYAHLMQQLGKSLSKAAESAAERNHRLVIAFDAVDNAVDAACRAPIQSSDCFVPLLGRIRWPDNCTVVVSARTENLLRLDLDFEYHKVEIEGFTPSETAEYIRSFLPDIDDGLIAHIHERTRGNPRVLSSLIEDIGRERPSDLYSFVGDRARETAIEYYEQECTKRLKSKNDRLIMAVLVEMTQFALIHTLASVVGRSVDEVRTIMESLYFGLRVHKSGEIRWRDQDFFEFLASYTEGELAEARDLLVKYCQEKYDMDDYASSNLSRHLYAAGRDEQLLNWWLADNRLTSRIRDAKSYREDVLEDVQYALLAANRLGRFADGLKLLSLVSDILQARDVLASQMKDYPSVAIECGYLKRLLEYLREQPSDHELASSYFTIASALAEHGERLDLAEDLAQRGVAIVRQESRKDANDRRGFSLEDVRHIALFDAWTSGLRVALERMRAWQPQEAVHSIYATVTRKWASKRGKEALDIIESIELDEHQRAYCLLGLLNAADTGLGKQVLEKLASVVIGLLEAGLVDEADAQDMVPGIIEQLLQERLRHSATDLFPFWPVPKPSSRHSSNIGAFLARKALETVLEIDTFNPEEFELDPLPAHVERPERYEHERQRELEELRSIMKKRFPCRLCRAKALCGMAEEGILQEVQDCLRPWLRDVDNWWYRPQYDFVYVACELLEAMTHVPGYHPDVVCLILDTVERVLAGSTDRGYTRYADILSRDSRYQAQAEQQIKRQREHIASPGNPASEAVQSLLSLHPIAARFDKELAYDLFSSAQHVASEWDGDIGGRAFALVRTAQRAQSEASISREQLGRFATVFEYIRLVAFESASVRLNEVLRLMARADPSFAFEFLERLETSDLIDFKIGLVAIALGMLDAEQVHPGLLWPIGDLADALEEGIGVYRKGISQLLSAGLNPSRALTAYAKYIRTMVPRELRQRMAHEFCVWASGHGLRLHATVQSMFRFADGLEKLGVGSAASASGLHSFAQESSGLYQRYCQKAQESPQLALSTLLQASTEDVRGLREFEIQEMVDFLTESLPSAQFPKLVAIIEKWAAEWVIPRALSLLAKVAHKGGSSKTVLDCVKDGFGRLLTPSAISMMKHAFYHAHFSAMLECEVLDLTTRFEIMLSAVADHLRELHSDELHWLIGQLGELLSPSQALQVFDFLLDRAIDKLPEQPAFEPVKQLEPLPALIKFLGDRLGHPRQATRWLSLHALAGMAINLPEQVVRVLVAQLQDEGHPRWMTKREWLLFLLHHLSLRIPSDLAPHIPVFLNHALNADFPHAKMRFHAKEVLLNIEKEHPGALSPEMLAQVRLANEPRELISRDELASGSIPYDGARWTQRKSRAFAFDPMDTLPYWYSPLAHCFGRHRCHVADIAHRWIIDKWGITDDKCFEEQKINRTKYGWQETSHGHGGEPAVETLRLYAERHAMFMAAGVLIDSKPVVFQGEREGDRWHDWMRYHLREADVALPSRLIDAPPIIADNYGIFPSKYEVWARKDAEEDFRNELFVADQPGWLVVASKRSGTFGDRQFEARVMSALVSPETSQALARLCFGESDYIALPCIEASYDTVLPEFESDLVNRGDYYVSHRDEIEDDSGLLELRTLLVSWHQELPFHTHDPKWPENGRAHHFPTMDFCMRLGLRREPMSLRWFDDAGETGAYHEIWHDHDGRGEYSDYADGHRLVVRKDVLCRYLKVVDLDLIFVVTLARQRPYRYHRGSGERYDLGTKRAYILSAEGQLQ